MQKINFQNLPSTTTPINATNLNAIQTNTENAINDVDTELGKAVDLFNDTSGNDWEAFLKNKLDYCMANMDSSKTHTSAFINGGWQGVSYGFGICSKINDVYQLVWFCTQRTYYCLYFNNTYNYEILDGNKYTLNNAVVGRYVDGKPIYRVTIQTTGDNNNAQTLGSLTNPDSIVSVSGWVKNGTTSRNVYSCFYGALTWASQIYISGSDIVMECGDDMKNFKNGSTIRITIEYTKTTD